MFAKILAKENLPDTRQSIHAQVPQEVHTLRLELLAERKAHVESQT